MNIHKVVAYIVYPAHCDGKNSAMVALTFCSPENEIFLQYL